MHAFLDYIAAHPHVALLVVLAVAFLESVALIGTVVPAAAVMFAAGALVGGGALDLWLTLALAVAGAIAGDGLSYELGRAQAGRIRGWRGLHRYGDVLARGEDFVRRHGGKSILFARFIGPLRAVVPLVAGVADLPRTRFYLVNILSACVWAPVHILPGVLFGASMRVAEAVTARLALLLVVLVALLWFAVWLVRIGLRVVLPALRLLRDLTLAWARRQRARPARLLAYLLDPSHPESQLLLSMAVIGAGWAFIDILEDVIGHSPLVQVDLAVFNFLQGLRTSAVDNLMVAITTMGSGRVLAPLVLTVLAWLILRRNWRTAVYWLGAAACYVAVVQPMKYLMGRERPTAIYADAVFEQFSFPSGHATSSMVIYGFLAFLLSRGRSPAMRAAVLMAAAAWIALIGFSRIYLGAHWFSDVVGGFSLGLAWIALLAMVYTHRRVGETLHVRGMAWLATATVVLCSAWHLQRHGAAELTQYAPRTQPQTLSLAQWSGQAWQRLPLRRIGIGGEAEEAFPLQWADSAEHIAARLHAAGWQPSAVWTPASALLWLSPDAAPADLPVLPKFHQGHGSRLAFVHVDPAQPRRRIVLRLWRSDLMVQAGERQLPVWYGALYRETFERRWHLATLGQMTATVARPQALAAWPKDVPQQLRQDKQGSVVLMLPPEPAALVRRSDQNSVQSPPVAAGTRALLRGASAVPLLAGLTDCRRCATGATATECATLSLNTLTACARLPA